MNKYGFPNDDRSAISYEIDNDDRNEKRLPSGKRGRKFNIQDIIDQGGIPYIAPVLTEAEKLSGADIISADSYTREVVPKTQIDLDNELDVNRQMMVVTSWQFKKALNRSGAKRGQVNAFVINPATGDDTLDQDIKDGWISAGSYKRLDATVLYIQGRLGWTDEEVDGIFVLATTL